MSNRIDLDLGDGHTLRWVAWAPDRKLNPQYAGIPDNPRAGAIVTHQTDKTESGLCEGYLGLDPTVGDTAVWTVISWEPLTLTPSLLCSCGDHGFITNGKWVRA